MPDLKAILAQALAETHASAEAVSAEEFDRFARAVATRRRFFVTGEGRTGLVARAFAMRIAQLGLNAHVVGETTTPSIGDGDALIACSGSGETPTVCYRAEKAKELGATVLCVTARPRSRLANLADERLTIPVAASEQLGNARFEQTLLLILDALAIALAQHFEIPPATIWKNHANLE